MEQVVPRLKARYREEVVPAMMKEFGYKNVWQVPRIVKVVARFVMDFPFESDDGP
jgi:large subunit ribosomal protein L5